MVLHISFVDFIETLLSYVIKQRVNKWMLQVLGAHHLMFLM